MYKEQQLKLNDTTLSYLTWGEPGQLTILALHGWLDNAASFIRLAPLLEGYRVIALDTQGHGHSDHLQAEQVFDYQRSIDLICEAIDALQLESVILMGHSIGGAMAHAVAARLKQRITKLVLVDAIGPMSQESVQVPGMLQQAVNLFIAAERNTRKVYPELEQMVQSRASFNQVSVEDITPLVERATVAVDGGYRWRFDRQLKLREHTQQTEAEVLALTAEITCPVLIVAASQGILQANEFLAERRARFQDLQVIELKGGHHLHLSVAADVARVVLDFLVS